MVVARIAALVVAALVAVPAAGSRTPDASSVTYVLRAAPGSLAAAEAAVRGAGGSVVRRMPSVEALAVRLPRRSAAALLAHPAVVGLVRDVRVRLAGNGEYVPKSDVNSLYTAEFIVGARRAWDPKGQSPGYTGSGIDIAVIDSGVTPVPGLDGPGKLIHGPDLSFDSQNAALTRLDAYGHGTHIAGIIAARDAGVNPKVGIGNDKYFLGVAPDARIVSIKVADAYGATDVSQVIAAIDWVVQHRNRHGLAIRVLNLAFATPSLQPYTIDPLAHAAQVAWRKGIVVVAAAGNDGTGTGKLLTPAQDPYVIAVGADDPRGTIGTEDDVIPTFSTRGNGVRNPDVVAPGASLQSLRVPGSVIDSLYGAGPGSIDARFFRGSGTSQAAAIVSGAAAILLEARPTLTPDEVKALLMRTARELPAADRQAQGHGIVDVARAVDATRTSVVAAAPPVGTGTGSLDASRGGIRVVLDGIALAGERDIFGLRYDAVERAAAREAERAWDGGSWNGTVWTGESWAVGAGGAAWAGSTWAGSTWAGSTWAGSTWANQFWNGSTWGGSTWGGSTWAGSTWGGSTWGGSTWAVGAWR